MLLLILPRDELAIAEIDIFKAIVMWGNVHGKEEAKDLIMYVRVPLISPRDLSRHVKPSGTDNCCR